jgi:hypothetical protein
MLMFPVDDPRPDSADVFVFASLRSPGKEVLIFDVNPVVTSADFDPEAVHRLKTPAEPAR